MKERLIMKKRIGYIVAKATKRLKEAVISSDGVIYIDDSYKNAREIFDGRTDRNCYLYLLEMDGNSPTYLNDKGETIKRYTKILECKKC